MTEETQTPGTPSEEPAGEPQPDAAEAGQGIGEKAQEWLGQLQAMIDRIAHEAAPVAKQVAAKAAELAAAAGEKAGPIAKRAAEMTEDVGAKVAERGRKFADDLRHPNAPDAPADAAPEAAAPAAEPPAAEGEAGPQG